MDATARRQADRGYSLIELIVVILIVGILAAIAIPTLLGQRRQAFAASVKSDLHNVAIAVAAASHADTATIDEAAVRTDVRISPSNTVEVVATGSGYCLRGWHDGTPASGRWMVLDGALAADDGTSCVGSPVFSLP